MQMPKEAEPVQYEMWTVWRQVDCSLSNVAYAGALSELAGCYPLTRVISNLVCEMGRKIDLEDVSLS